MKYSLESFEKNGVAFPFNLNEDLLKSTDILNLYNDFQSKAQSKFGKRITLKPNLLSLFFDKLCFNSDIIKKVKSLIGPNLYIWSSAIFEKPENSTKLVSYHQDNPYWQLSTNKVVTVWVALTESKEVSGALQVFPESYKLGVINSLDIKNADASYQKGLKTTPENDMLSYKQNLKTFLEKNNPVTINLEPKQYSIHHVNCVHGSKLNKSRKPRIGFAIRYISSETTHLNRKLDSALHVCGKKNNYYIDEVRPTESFSESAIQNYEFAMKSAGSFGNKKY